jgi:hypothetical protein
MREHTIKASFKKSYNKNIFKLFGNVAKLVTLNLLCRKSVRILVYRNARVSNLQSKNRLSENAA